MTILGGKRFTDVLLEKYVGNSSKEFPVIEAELKKIIKIINAKFLPLRDRIAAGGLLHEVQVNDINLSDSNKTIERMFKQFFKLKEFSLNWIMNPEPNAFTPINTFILFDKNFKTESDGRRTNEKLFVGVNLHVGLVAYCNMNEKELVAIILHEIGHNFYNSIFNILPKIGTSIADLFLDAPKALKTILTNLAISGVFDLIGFNKLYQASTRTIQELLHKYFPWIMKIVDFFRDFMYNVGSIFNINMLDIITDIPYMAKKFLSFPFKYLFHYNVEKHADSFAADYGYGTALASALNKLVIQEKSFSDNVANVPVLNWLVDFFNVQFEIVRGLIGTYPIMQNRIRTGLDRLNRASKDESLPPKVRAELKEQIAEYEEFYAKYRSIENDENKKRVFSWMYKNALEELFAGKMDIRELIHALDPKKYN